MKKKIIGIFISLLMLATCIGPTIFTENESNVTATSTTGGNVGLDYNTIYEKLENLSYIVFNPSLKDYNIIKGRDFGTNGEREAAKQIRSWMENFSTNLTGSEVHKESIGYYNDDDDYWYPRKADILGFSLQLRNGTDDPISISTNESFPVVPKGLMRNPKRFTDFTTVELYNFTMDNTYPLDEYDYLTFNVTYTRIQDLENLSEIGLDDELVYVENYSNASAEDIEGRVHLLNVSDNELNDTLNFLADTNATGFILIKDDPSSLQGWELPLPGITVSEENGSLIKSYIQNESLINVSAVTSIIPIPDQGNLEIYYYNSSVFGQNKRILLINSESVEGNMKRLGKRLRSCSVVGALVYSTENDNETHWEWTPHVLEAKKFFGFSTGSKSSMKSQFDSFSSYIFHPKPTFYINRSIFTENGEQIDIDQWVDKNEIKAKFYLNWSKNYNVESYNVYCTVPGKDPSKTIIISGGHYDGFWMQSSTDNAAGVAVMLGVLKYMNDHHITPKYNLTFITFSGEEYIDKGSRGYVLRHWDEIKQTKIKCILNVDVIAHNIIPSNLYIHTYDRLQPFYTQKINSIVTEIAECTNYYERNNHNYSLVTAMPSKRSLLNGTTEEKYPATDAFPFWLRYITAINFGKEPYEEIRHQTGRNHTKGDVMTHIDPTDLEVTTDLFWNVSKFFCVDPHCYFEDESVEFDYLDGSDINSEKDAVNVSFTIKTVLPQEKATVKLILIPTYLSHPLHPFYPILYRYHAEKEFIVTPEGTNGYITLQLPKDAPKAKYRQVIQSPQLLVN